VSPRIGDKEFGHMKSKRTYGKAPILILLCCITALFYGACEQPSGHHSQGEDPAVLREIAVLSPPDTIVYARDQDFDPAGLVVEARFSDETRRELSPDEYTLSGYDTQKPGAQMVTVRTEGAETGFPIMVNSSTARLESISLDAPPLKTVYEFGTSLNFTGMKVTGHYSDGTAKTETVYTALGYDKVKRGSQTVTIRINRKEVSFDAAVRVPANAQVSMTDKQGKPVYRNVYIKKQPFAAAAMTAQVKVNGVEAVLKDFVPADLSYNPNPVFPPGHKAVFQNVTLTIDDINLILPNIATLDGEPDLYFDYGYMRTAEDPAGRGRQGGAFIGEGGYTIPRGRTLVLAPVRVMIGYYDDSPAGYDWTVTGPAYTSSTSNSGEFFHFTPSAEGEYSLSVTVSGKGVDGEPVTRTASTKVRCTPAPASPPAPITGGFSSPLRNFAPGQFTVSGTGTGWSLGAWGGYAVFRFRAVNNGGYSFNIYGNAFLGWSEPGVVWVMADENQNGKPDDTWYELKGSADTQSPARVTRRFAVTYILVDESDGVVNEYGQTIQQTYWFDSRGGAGAMGGGWPSGAVPGKEVTYTGTNLLYNADDIQAASEGYSSSPAFDWGYVDNCSKKTITPEMASAFRIRDAIRQDGSPADLPWIDFVKVHTGVFSYGSVFGEISTELTGLENGGTTGPVPY
jgi:hypothetical protein